MSNRLHLPWAEPWAGEEWDRKSHWYSDFFGGGSGIRTHDTVARIHAFQACAFSHSAIPPAGRGIGGTIEVAPPSASRPLDPCRVPIQDASWPGRQKAGREIVVVRHDSASTISGGCDAPGGGDLCCDRRNAVGRRSGDNPDGPSCLGDCFSALAHRGTRRRSALYASCGLELGSSEDTAASRLGGVRIRWPHSGFPRPPAAARERLRQLTCRMLCLLEPRGQLSPTQVLRAPEQ